MNREMFYKILTENNINLEIVCFDDNVKDDVFCVRKNYFRWETLYRERGKEYNCQGFPSESDALKNVLDEIFKMYGKEVEPHI